MVYLTAATLCQFMTFETLVAGRTIAGIGSGFNSVCLQRFVEEYAPLALFSTASPAIGFMAQLGNFSALMMGLTQPPLDLKPAEEEVAY